MQTILHLSDIHFGLDGKSSQDLANRNVCLNSLLDELKKLESSWKPTIICVTGDIGWSGAESDYAAAKEWLDKVLASCGLSYDALVVCAGNHDSIRSVAKRIPRPKSTKEADEVLAVPIAPHFEGPFASFISFCQTAKIPALKLGDSESYLVGERIVNDVHFVVMNSAWFCKGDDDRGELWLGYPHMMFMESHGQMLVEPSQDNRMTISLAHHPHEWYNENEIHTYSRRPNVMDYLANRCHLVLTGHTHGEIREPDRIADHALHFTGGASYAGASHFNSFRLIRLNSGCLEDRAFEFNPTAVSGNWKSGVAKKRHLSYTPKTEITIPINRVQFKADALRASCHKEAVRLLELKSRLLKPEGQLPVLVQRPVSLRVSDQHDVFDATEQLVRPKDTETTLSLYEAVREARRTLLLGDLGTGKSTLAAQLVIDTLDRSATAVAVLIPAKMLRLAGVFTRRDMLVSVANYIKDAIWLESSDFSLEKLLDQRVEVVLVFDGLDELSRDIAARLLSEAAAVVENWSTIQVVATARPVELVGTSFSDWRIIHTVSLDDAAKNEFLRQELAADDVLAEQIDWKAKKLLCSLKENTALDSIANSPLAIRLIYARLKEFSTKNDLTLGDLLYDVLMDRIGGWEKRDGKPSQFLHLSKFLSPAEAKAEYFAVLACRAAIGTRLQRDEAKRLLNDAGVKIAGADTHLLAEEALSYLEWLGLISVSETVDFTLQPLAEVCAATGLVAQWRSNGRNASLQNRSQWRIASFAAAIIRRRGLMNELRTALTSIVTFLLDDPDYVPAVCYIVAESADSELAKIAVRLFDNLQYRPLRYFQNEWNASARNIAKTLALAEDVGFDWFFTDYLDPRYPIPNAGCAIVSDVLSEWAALVWSHLKPDQIEKLKTLVRPYRATGEGVFYGVLTRLSLLVPDAFTSDERIHYQSCALAYPLFSDFIASEFKSIWNDAALGPIVNREVFSRCGGSIQAAWLWLENNQTEDLPHDIIRLAISSVVRASHSADEVMLIKQCKDRLGEEIWLRFARWFLIAEESGTSIGAAKVLFDHGERRLSVLGDVVMDAMHDGRYVVEAEKMLHELIRNRGENGVRWLAYRIARFDEWYGAYSGWWRVLLPLLNDLADGPQLLVNCIRNLGSFTIPRYPEIREAFMRMLEGSRRVEFHDALRNQLTSLDPQTRSRAAFILISSAPNSEADALFVAVRSRAHQDNSDLHEWESFLLTLKFGPSVLSSLKGNLGQLDPRARALALVILNKGGVKFDVSLHAELLETLVHSGNWHLCHESAGLELLGSTITYEICKTYLQSQNLARAERAAEWLLKFHSKRLSSLEMAKCMTIRHSGMASTWTLTADLTRIAREPNFAHDLMVVCNEIVENGGYPPLLGIAAKAIIEHIGWKDVLWVLLCDDTHGGGSFESEAVVMALLEFGFKEKSHKQFIGEAANDCLTDPRFMQSRHHEAYHWMALLADEFVGIDKETIHEAILHGKPIAYSATTALIARLGYIPDGFSCDREKRHCVATEVPSPHRSFEIIITDIKEFSRTSNDIHPNLLNTIQEILLHSEVNESTLNEIVSIGKIGILIAALLRFVYGLPQRLPEMIQLFEIWPTFRQDEQHAPKKQLVRALKNLREFTLFEDGATKEECLVALDNALIDGRVWKLAIARDILQLRGALLNEQIPVVFTECVDAGFALHSVIFSYLCNWLGKDMDTNTQSILVAASENAICKLNETNWRTQSEWPPNPWANLLMPTVFWANGGRSSNAAGAVFLRGIRAVFETKPNSDDMPRANLVGLLSQLEPILTKVPPEILRSTINRGIESLEPSVSVFCRMIEAFASKC